jgi:hypothetical protein
MARVCQKKMCSMARDVEGPMNLRSFIGLTRQAAPRALRSLSLISMLRPVEDGGIGLFLMFQERPWSSACWRGKQGFKKDAPR